VPLDLRTFLSAPPGLSAPEQLFYAGLARGAARLLSPTTAPLAGMAGRGRHDVRARAELALTRLQLRGMRLALGPRSPSEQAARFRLGTGPAPSWA
jgi:hypothetical protein